MLANLNLDWKISKLKSLSLLQLSSPHSFQDFSVRWMLLQTIQVHPSHSFGLITLCSESIIFEQDQFLSPLCLIRMLYQHLILLQDSLYHNHV